MLIGRDITQMLAVAGRSCFSYEETTMAKTIKYKVGRDAGTGQFIPVKEAERRKKEAVVETIKRKK